MLYAGYRFAEGTQCTETMVLAYPGHVIHTSPQRELLHALVMFISSPETLAADQLEVSYRIAGRMTSFFEISDTPESHFTYQVELASSTPPHRTEQDQTGSKSTRFFSAAQAVPALQKIVVQNENDPIWRERRFGSEFTPAGKLTVLKHLMTYWAAEPPHRHMVRRAIQAAIEVAHSFRTISQLVTHIDAGHDAEQDAEDRQLQDVLGEAARRGEHRVDDDAPDERAGAAVAIGHDAEDQAAAGGRDERERGELPGCGGAHAERRHERRQHHRVEHDVEGVEHPAQARSHERAFRRERRASPPAEQASRVSGRRRGRHESSLTSVESGRP